MILYAAEGAPIGFIWWALPTLLRTAGVSIEQITSLTALVLVPWICKFLWAPLVDALRTPWWGFRAWIAAAQLLMGLSLVPLLWLDPAAHFGSWRTLLLIHAFAAATQDVAVDGLAINSVPKASRGLLNGCMQAGMLAGRSVFGGGALLVFAWLGYGGVLILLIAWIWIALAAVLLVRVAEPTGHALAPRAFGRILLEVLRVRRTWMGLAFALTSAAAFEATGQLAGPFLVDRGAAAATIGLFFGIVVVLAMLTGGMVGGTLADRWGRPRAVAVFLSGCAAMVLALAAADAAGAGTAALLALLAGLYVCVGLFTAASYALFMDLTDPRLGGTQFSTYMAATNACESWAVWAGGAIAGRAGYPTAFAAMAVVSLITLPLLRWLRPGSRQRS
jgi:MFS family permease